MVTILRPAIVLGRTNRASRRWHPAVVLLAVVELDLLSVQQFGDANACPARATTLRAGARATLCVASGLVILGIHEIPHRFVPKCCSICRPGILLEADNAWWLGALALEPRLDDAVRSNRLFGWFPLMCLLVRCFLKRFPPVTATRASKVPMCFGTRPADEAVKTPRTVFTTGAQCVPENTK